MTAQAYMDYIALATQHAAISLLWQATDVSENGGDGYPIGDAGVDADFDYVDRVADLITEDVTAFVADNYDLLIHAGVTAEMAGHDLILTSGHHGAGFWDRGLGAAGDMLTSATRGYSFDAEFRLWNDDADGDEHLSDELAWLMVENTVLVDELNWSAA
jgi:hypothetical protein